jgi:hypothetical protein
MFSLRICQLALSVSALLCTSVSAQRKPLFTSPLPTGVRIDPAGEAFDLGSVFAKHSAKRFRGVVVVVFNRRARPELIEP